MSSSHAFARDVDDLVRARARPLCVLFDRELRVVDLSGDATHYGYADLHAGASGPDCLPFIVGFGGGDDLDFVFLETPNGRSAEVHWTAASDGGWRLVLLDVSLARDQVREIQSIANESRLLKYRLEQTAERLQESQTELARLAYRDPLTGLYNHRAFHETFEREVQRAMREQLPLALILLDVDFFKRYNDRYGHLPGDRCLLAVAGLIEAQAQRPADVAARVGGEEFALLLPQTNLAAAEGIAQRLRQTLLDAALPHEESPFGIVTASVGVALLPEHPPLDPAKALYRIADAAQYQAKRNGRNTVVAGRFES